VYDATRREYILDHAQNEGRIAAASRPHWAALYERDPGGTEATLAILAPTPIGTGVLGQGDPVEATLAAGRALIGGEHVSASTLASSPPVSTSSPAAGNTSLTPEQVKAWTSDLFPETRASGARQGRITQDAA
jgi:hypothetical protein